MDGYVQTKIYVVYLATACKYQEKNIQIHKFRVEV